MQRIKAALALVLGVVGSVLSAQSSSETDIYFVHSDHLGTPQVLTDNDQNIVWQANYTPFGEADIVVEQVEMPLRFPGQYYDKETGYHYNYFRTYDPSTGRYLQSDPIGLNGGLNTYAYVGGNPLIYTDPLGLAYSPRGEHGLPGPGPSAFEEGFADYFSNLASLGNPYKPGSCEYDRRVAAIAAAEAAINTIPHSPTLQETIADVVAEQVQSNPEYYAGRTAANFVVGNVVGRLGMGRAGRVGLGASASTTGFSFATFMALVEQIEGNMPECDECES